MESKSVLVPRKLVGIVVAQGNPELPGEKTQRTPSPHNPNFLGLAQVAISKRTVKGWRETLLTSLRVSIFFPKSWIRPWECICLFFLVTSLPLAESYNPFREDLFIWENCSIAVKR